MSKINIMVTIDPKTNKVMAGIAEKAEKIKPDYSELVSALKKLGKFLHTKASETKDKAFKGPLLLCKKLVTTYQATEEPKAEVEPKKEVETKVNKEIKKEVETKPKSKSKFGRRGRPSKEEMMAKYGLILGKEYKLDVDGTVMDITAEGKCIVDGETFATPAKWARSLGEDSGWDYCFPDGKAIIIEDDDEFEEIEPENDLEMDDDDELELSDDDDDELDSDDNEPDEKENGEDDLESDEFEEAEPEIKEEDDEDSDFIDDEDDLDDWI